MRNTRPVLVFALACLVLGGSDNGAVAANGPSDNPEEVGDTDDVNEPQRAYEIMRDAFYRWIAADGESTEAMARWLDSVAQTDEERRVWKRLALAARHQTAAAEEVRGIYRQAMRIHGQVGDHSITPGTSNSALHLAQRAAFADRDVKDLRAQEAQAEFQRALEEENRLRRVMLDRIMRDKARRKATPGRASPPAREPHP